MQYAEMSSPVGPLLLARDAAGVRQIRFLAGETFSVPQDWERSERGLADVRRQLREYFAGTRRTFELELAPAGTEFRKQVWAALLEIPYGVTASYLDIANRIGNPGAIRAVGAANGANPIPIVIPCHRVIGSDGSLTGYGGGLESKHWLLRHEGVEVEGQMGLFDQASPGSGRP